MIETDGPNVQAMLTKRGSERLPRLADEGEKWVALLSRVPAKCGPCIKSRDASHGLQCEYCVRTMTWISFEAFFESVIRIHV